MLRKYFGLSLLFLQFLYLPEVNAQKVENLRFEQVGKQIIIYYDLNETQTGQNFEVKVFCSTDGGKTSGSQLRQVTGDAGSSITGGKGKKIIWDVLAEREKLIGDILFEIQVKKRNYNNDLTSRKIEGKVRTIVESEYTVEIKKKEIKKAGLSSKYITEYDDKWNLIEYDRYKPGGSLDYKFTNKFDERGNRIEYIRFKSDGSMDYKYKYKYDDKWNLMESDRYKPDGSFESKVVFLNDQNGNRGESKYYKVDGSLDYSYTYKYDEKGNTTEYSRFKSGDSLEYSYTYKHNDKGNTIESNRFKSDGSLDYKWTNKYDDQGNNIEMIWYKSDGSLDYKSTYRYDEKGNRIEYKKFKTDGSLDFIETCKFDKYDINGNWIIQTVFRNDSPTKIIERDIIYY